MAVWGPITLSQTSPVYHGETVDETSSEGSCNRQVQLATNGGTFIARRITGKPLETLQHNLLIDGKNANVAYIAENNRSRSANSTA
jgi:hypothetical protein